MISRNLGGFALCGKKLIVPVMRACYEGFALITGYELFAMGTFLIMRLIVPQVRANLPCNRVSTTKIRLGVG